MDRRNTMESSVFSTPARGFRTVEFADRLSRAQDAMAAEGIDLLLLTTEHDVRYFSGFHTPFWQSPTRPWFLLIPQSGPPVAVIPSIGEVCMKRTWVKDIRSWPSPRPHDEGVSLLTDSIHELIGVAGCIGLQTGPGTHLRMPLADMDRLKRGLKSTRWKDSTSMLERLRAIKSPAEIEKIRQVCRAASRAFARLPQLIDPGMTDLDLFREFRISCLKAGADNVSYLVGSVGQGGYDDIISPPNGQRLRRGDVFILDTGCEFDGYFCDFDRNYAIGEAGEAVTMAHRIAWEATEAGMAAAKPGVRCSDLFAIMQSVMTPHAVASGGTVGRLGHGLGMQLTEPPSLMAAENTELQANMVMTLEPGFAFAAGKTMVHEENILITEQGCELLSERAPSSLPIIEWPRCAH